MRILTIGFTNKTAENFFEKLAEAGVSRVVDVRLNNVSQLAGFSKKNDLKYFLRAISGIDYVHLPELAPTKDILDEYKKEKGSWTTYEAKFMELMRYRRVEDKVSKEIIDNGCLLCSEEKPHHCHRRLVAEYLRESWGEGEISHIG